MYHNVFGEKVSRKRYKEMVNAAKNRRELITAGLTSRRDLMKLGLLTAGGMLVAIRRLLPAVAQLRLEIPSAPVAALALLPEASRSLRAKALRSTPAEGYYLLGLKFARPLLLAGNSRSRSQARSSSASNGRGRKIASAV